VEEQRISGLELDHHRQVVSPVKEKRVLLEERRRDKPDLEHP